jgi:formate hydrogenlyase transcriptional activator
MVNDRRFRADLYYRLNVFPIQLPALRERAGDIPDLAIHFVRHFAQRMNKTIDEIPDHVMDAIRGHDWPGNIRELQNFIERVVVMTEGRLLCPALPELTHSKPAAPSKTGRTMVEMERVHITETLQKTNWVVGGPAGAAARLGLPRTTLIARMRKLGIARDTSGLGASWHASPALDRMQHEDHESAFAHVAGI